MQLEFGTVKKVIIRGHGGENGWSAYVKSADGDVKLHYRCAILPDRTFAECGRHHPRLIVEGEKVAYVPMRDPLGRLRAKAWRPLKW